VKCNGRLRIGCRSSVADVAAGAAAAAAAVAVTINVVRRFKCVSNELLLRARVVLCRCLYLWLE